MASTDKYLVKVTKGMFKFTDNTITTEITKGVYLNLKAEYKWNSDTELDLKLSWEPHSSEGPYSASSLTTSFSSPLGELNINGTRIGNQILENTYNTTLTNINSNAQNITITFKYVNGNALVDLTQDFNKLVIPKPNKYDNNVVFNRDGLNEMIDYFLKYPVRSIEESENYGHITIAHGKDEAEDISVKGLGHNGSGLTITTNLLPNEDATYDLGVKDEENENNNLRWKNLYLSNNANVDGTVNATTLTGELTGGSININDKFKVDSQGNVVMQGSITGMEKNFIYLYHKGTITTTIDGETTRIAHHPPEDLPQKNSQGEYEEFDVASSSNEKRWHSTFNSNGQDHWKTITFDGGVTWLEPEYINPEDGAPGGWSNDNILEALKSVDDGLYWFPGDTMEDGNEATRLGIRSTAVASLLATFGKIDMGVMDQEGKSFAKSNTYWANNNKALMGGYITFPIPAPITVSTANNYAALGPTGEGVTTPEQRVAAINEGGWRGRVGYMRGNGNGKNPTAGLGIAIYTTATFKDIYHKDVELDNVPKMNPITNIPEEAQDNVAEKCHLILSFFVLTDSGIALMTRANTTNSNAWVFKDVMEANDVGSSSEPSGNDVNG